MSTTDLRIEQLVKTYPSGAATLTILKDLDLQVSEGQKIAISGASGCGKTTLLHLIGGMDQPDSGRILFGEQDLSQIEPAALALYRNREVGFVFQFHHLLPEFSAVENAMMPLLLRRQPASSARTRASQLLSQLGLGERLHHRPGELSGGEQQRVALARSLIGQPRLLLADEPTGNLDATTSQEIHELLMEVHDDFALTSVIVTHDPRLAGLCDQGWKLEFGKLERID